MKRAMFLIIFFLFSYISVFSQDTTRIALFIDNKEVKIDKEVKIEIRAHIKKYPIEILENKYFITNNIDGKFSLFVKYKMFTMSYRIETWVLRNRLNFNIDTYPFENGKKNIIFNKKKKYLYFVSISPYLSRVC